MTRSKDHICVLFPRKCFLGDVFRLGPTLRPGVKTSISPVLKLARPPWCFHKSGVPWGRGPEKVWEPLKKRHTPYIFPTRDLTAVKLEAQCNAVRPRLRSDSYKAGQDWLWDPIENHLCGIRIPVENLSRERSRWNFMLILSFPSTAITFYEWSLVSKKYPLQESLLKRKDRGKCDTCSRISVSS